MTEYCIEKQSEYGAKTVETLNFKWNWRFAIRENIKNQRKTIDFSVNPV